MKKFLLGIFALFLIFDLAISYKRYATLNLDGDLVPITHPSEWYSKVLKDPFGWKAVTTGEKYAATNRFWAHKSMDLWFNKFHSVYQTFWTNKIACLYSSQGLFDTLVHLALLVLLATYCVGHTQFWKFDFLLAACLISPFFMTYGWNEIIGLVLNSVTYCFFYSLPMAVFLLFFLPYYLAFYHNQPIEHYLGGIVKKAIWAFLIVYISFSGVILQPIAIMVSAAILLFRWKQLLPEKNIFENSLKQIYQSFFKIEKEYSVFLPVFVLMLFYSFYVGTFNLENAEPIPLAERYTKLFQGFKVMWTYKRTYWFVAGLLLLNLGIIYTQRKDFFKSKFFHFFLWGLLITGIYIFLLPLGGYRPYRPVILRFDTVLPMNIFLIWLVSFSSYYLINHLQGKYKLLYLVPLLGVLGIFYQVDEFKFNEYECQNHSLYLMQTTTQPPVILNKDCPIFAWIPSEWDVHHNEVNNMLKRWGISTQSKEYHYK